LSIQENALGPDHPDVAVSLSRLAGRYLAQGRNGEAEPLLQRALSIRERALGPDQPDLAVSLNNLAGVDVDQKRYAAAGPLYWRALPIFEKALGPELDPSQPPESAHPLAWAPFVLAGEGGAGR
jgi:tetratricopeptide (TPR) repeat protein